MRAAIAGLLLAVAGGSAALAATATVTGKIEREGYARIVFAFDLMPKVSARIANNVLVLTFSEPVSFELGRLTRDLSGVVGVVRRDPDGAGLRISLDRPLRLNTTEAGETLFVDLLPVGWSGMPPGIPREVIAALGRAAREAREAREAEARLSDRSLRPLTVQGATHPTFRRLIFGVDDAVPVDFKRAGDRVAVTFGAPLSFNLAAAKAGLPAEFLTLDAKRDAKSLTITAPAPKDVDVRGFRDDEGYILDIDRADAPARPAGGEASRPAPGEHAPAPAASRPAVEANHSSPPVLPPAAPPAGDAPAQAASPAAAGARLPTPPAPAAPAEAAPAQAAALAPPSIRKDGDTLRLTFPFQKAPPAAVFLRGRTLWAVFDDPAPLALDALVKGSGGAILSAADMPLDRGRAVRLRLRDRPLVSAAVDGGSWIVSLGDAILGRTEPIALQASFGRDGRGLVTAALGGLGLVRSLDDPEVGDRLSVATLAGPPRALSRSQHFVEFAALPTAQGLAFVPAAEDVAIRAELDVLTVSREAGLTLSTGAPIAAASAAAPSSGLVLDAAAWGEANEARFEEREHALLAAAADAEDEARTEARIELGRYYVLRGRWADAAATLRATIEDDAAAERDGRVPILRAAAELGLGHADEAAALLAPAWLAANPEAALWRAAAEAERSRLGPAREALRQGQPALAALPAALQARFLTLATSLALDARDHSGAVAAFEQLEALPASRAAGARVMMRARIAEALGQDDKAIAGYGDAARTGEPAIAAEAELRTVALGNRTGRIAAPEATERLERLVTGWRGDWIEAEGLARLIALYADAERWRDGFAMLKTAVEAFPDAEGTRDLQDRMQSRFADLFLGEALDRMSKLDALALFYDFQELSPTGRRGDEMVRRLADKLVEVDLLDQAAELLEYQIDNRLAGAARAQVAARAALVNLMNGKPASAVKVLQRTRLADLPASLVQTRLMLEARALAQTGRLDLALEMAAGLTGPERLQLRADILWTARRWAEAGEALEARLGASWRSSAPLDAGQRADALRAAIALSLAEDSLGVDRLRQKYAAKMADSPDARAFEVVTAPVEARGDAFREIARSIAATASFEGFLQEYRERERGQPAAEAAQPEAASSAKG
jgi:hypothetical protein